jgi:protein phosphatase
MNALTLDYGACTDRGHHRAVNEDAVLAHEPAFIVADGMGNHDAGERASSIAVTEMGKLGRSVTVEDVRDALARARAGINRLRMSTDSRAAGTTVPGVVLTEQAGQPYWLVLNLGDSRTYRVVNGLVQQVSVDHSEFQELIETGAMSPDQARQYSRRHVITRVLGARTVERPEYWLIPAQPPERWMICSDGLTGELDDTQIGQILLDAGSPQMAADTLVAAALAAGGRDNVSVVVVDAGGPPTTDDTTLDLYETTVDTPDCCLLAGP